MINFEQVRKALQSQPFIKEIQSCVSSPHTTPNGAVYHFFVHATEGETYVGEHTQQDEEKLEAVMRTAGDFSFNKKVIQAWESIVNKTLTDCGVGYVMRRKNPLPKPDSGLFLLTELRYDPITETEQEHLNKALSSKGRRNDCPMLERMPTLKEHIILNKLRRAHQSATLARIVIHDSMEPHASLLLVHQKVPHMDDHTLSCISALDTFRHFLPGSYRGVKEEVEQTYQTAYGVLDLEQRAVLLDRDIVIAR